MTSPVAPPTSPSKPRRRTRLIGTVIALLAMVALGWLAWHLTHRPAAEGAGGPGMGGPGGPGGPGGGGGPGGPGGGRRGATTVGVATAETANLPVTLDALGTVTAAATTTVRPQVSGILQKVLFKEGQLVKAGQVLAQIDPRQFEMALLQATGQRQRDEAQLENARLTLERYRTLLTQDSIARQDVDTQAALVKQLEGTVMTDRAAEGTARLNLGYTKVVAPITGRVGLRVVDVGNLVTSGDTNGLAVITQQSPIDVEFAIPQDRVPDIMGRVATGASLAAQAYDRTRTDVLATGRFAALDNQVDTATGTVMAKARFDNDRMTLFPSQFVNVRLEMRTIQNAVLVPVTALRHGSTGDFVWVLNNDRTVSMRTVTRGQATVDKVQIATGLKVGEKVITEGADRLKDGAAVVLPGDKPKAGGQGARGQHRRGQAGQGASDSATAQSGPPTGANTAPAATPDVAPGAVATDASKMRRHRTDGSTPEREMPEGGGHSAPSAADGRSTAPGVGRTTEQPAAAR
ncbi:multidrug efflux system membrane fusion protein [Pseudoduganella lurida]|uniref:Multidrug efflux system membrane fusion protein n=1 Tax=Pseudoduganella lurida TaxID=1036180 RepID=A0A562RBY3_9BURK|nr:efflux RND transporter periplasmic adaptor subunit [Pseudoduganella lurida]TWI66548.1 multidrug efflux system membrane fusion protein [Pseudoduganella lurida]